MQESSSAVKSFIQTVTGDTPPMASDLRYNFEQVALFHANEFREKAQHYVIFSTIGDVVASYIYFAVSQNMLEIVGAFTETRWRKHGLVIGALPLLFSSHHAQNIHKFAVVFDREVTAERTGTHDALIRWFKTDGPRGTQMTVYFGGEPKTYIGHFETPN